MVIYRTLSIIYSDNNSGFHEVVIRERQSMVGGFPAERFECAMKQVTCGNYDLKIVLGPFHKNNAGLKSTE